MNTPDPINYTDRVFTLRDYENYLAGDKNTAIHRVWNGLIAQLPDDLKKEALDKGFTLKKEIDKKLELLNLTIEIPNASKELNDKFQTSLAYLICPIPSNYE